MTKELFLAALLAGASSAVSAAPRLCLNPHFDYEAHAIDAHNLVVKNTIGPNRTPLTVKTSCIDLSVAHYFSLSSIFTCIGPGDNVVATTIDGQREGCRVTGITSYPPPPPK
jgi:hypothetical protein